jgi:hypothetical protein
MLYVADGMQEYENNWRLNEIVSTIGTDIHIGKYGTVDFEFQCMTFVTFFCPCFSRMFFEAYNLLLTTKSPHHTTVLCCTLYYTTLHYTTLHYTTLHYTTHHYNSTLLSIHQNSKTRFHESYFWESVSLLLEAVRTPLGCSGALWQCPGKCGEGRLLCMMLQLFFSLFIYLFIYLAGWFVSCLSDCLFVCLSL